MMDVSKWTPQDRVIYALDIIDREIKAFGQFARMDEGNGRIRTWTDFTESLHLDNDMICSLLERLRATRWLCYEADQPMQDTTSIHDLGTVSIPYGQPNIKVLVQFKLNPEATK